MLESSLDFKDLPPWSGSAPTPWYRRRPRSGDSRRTTASRRSSEGGEPPRPGHNPRGRHSPLGTLSPTRTFTPPLHRGVITTPSCPGSRGRLVCAKLSRWGSPSPIPLGEYDPRRGGPPPSMHRHADRPLLLLGAGDGRGVAGQIHTVGSVDVSRDSAGRLEPVDGAHLGSDGQ